MENFKREKAKAKDGFTRSTQVIECLDCLAGAFENVICEYEKLRSSYETAGDIEKLIIMLCEAPLEFVALRTVAVYLFNGTKRVKVNAP